jgi:hypothetical protein
MHTNAQGQISYGISVTDKVPQWQNSQDYKYTGNITQASAGTRFLKLHLKLEIDWFCLQVLK